MGRRIYLLAPREECEDGAYCLRIFLAARSSPLQKVNHVRELKDSVAHERKGKDKWRERALEAQQELEPKELDNDRYAQFVPASPGEDPGEPLDRGSHLAPTCQLRAPRPANRARSASVRCHHATAIGKGFSLSRSSHLTSM